MASSEYDADEWDKSTSEIASEDSEALFDSRPNRWFGPTEQWNKITEEERLTYNAVESLRNQDLSAHLFNAYALRGISQGGQHIDEEAEEEVCHALPCRTGFCACVRLTRL